MPITYTIDHAQRFVLITATGAVTVDELVAMQARIGSDPAFSPDVSGLTDLRETLPLPAMGVDMRRLAHTTPFGIGAKRGILASGDVNFGLSRMLEVFATGKHDVRVFRDADAAYAWLGVSPP